MILFLITVGFLSTIAFLAGAIALGQAYVSWWVNKPPKVEQVPFGEALISLQKLNEQLKDDHASIAPPPPDFDAALKRIADGAELTVEELKAQLRLQAIYVSEHPDECVFCHAVTVPVHTFSTCPDVTKILLKS
jgi:hypothetical protein